jgi:single-strand DNA-binding protein
MANFNKVILAGNLTRDPELRYTPKGTAIARIGLAINRNWTTETGERKEEVTFVDVDAFGKTAETIGQYFKKGRPILMEGRLRYETWEDKQTNQKRSKLGVVLESFQFMDTRGGESGGGAPSRSSGPARSSSPAAEPPAESDAQPPEQDDVPF